jgi:hypothetical protein
MRHLAWLEGQLVRGLVGTAAAGGDPMRDCSSVAAAARRRTSPLADRGSRSRRFQPNRPEVAARHARSDAGRGAGDLQGGADGRRVDGRIADFLVQVERGSSWRVERGLDASSPGARNRITCCSSRSTPSW